MVFPLLPFIQRKAVKLHLITLEAAVLQILPPAAPVTPVQTTVTRDDCIVFIYFFICDQSRIPQEC